MADPKRYRLVTLNELLLTDLSGGRRPLPDGVYKQLREGALVKLYAEAVGKAEKCAECFWVIVLHRRGPNFEGRVNNRLGRSEHHSIKGDDLIQFHKSHIVDVGIFK